MSTATKRLKKMIKDFDLDAFAKLEVDLDNVFEKLVFCIKSHVEFMKRNSLESVNYALVKTDYIVNLIKLAWKKEMINDKEKHLSEIIKEQRKMIKLMFSRS